VTVRFGGLIKFVPSKVDYTYVMSVDNRVATNVQVFGNDVVPVKNFKGGFVKFFVVRVVCTPPIQALLVSGRAYILFEDGSAVGIAVLQFRKVPRIVQHPEAIYFAFPILGIDPFQYRTGKDTDRPSVSLLALVVKKRIQRANRWF